MSEARSTTDSGDHSPFGLPRSRSERDDAELCSEIRRHSPDSATGRAAFGELYARHRAPALHFALRLNRDRSRAEDAVSEAFAKLWRAWTNGRGPDTAFKPYLMAAVRSESYRRSATNRATAAVEPDVLTFLAGHEPGNHADEVAERDQLAKAFKALPQGWQKAITMIDIDGTATSSAADSMNLSVNSFSSLLRRAREGLRVSYLQQHVEPSRPECSEYTSEFARYVRGQLSSKRTVAINEHLRDCSSCRLQTFRLRSINSTFQAWITPAAVAAALIEFGRVEEGATFLLQSTADSAEQSQSAVGQPPAQTAGEQSLSTSAGSASSGVGGTATVFGSTLALKATIAGLAAAAAIAAGTITVINVQGGSGQPPASAQEQSTTRALEQPSAPTEGTSPDAAPSGAAQIPSDSPSTHDQQKVEVPAPSPARETAPEDDSAEPRTAEDDVAESAPEEEVEEEVESSTPSNEGDLTEESEEPTPAGPRPTRAPAPSATAGPESETSAEASGEADVDSGTAANPSEEAEAASEANEGRDQDTDPTTSDSAANDSSSSEQADTDGTDAAADNEGQAGAAADSDDADGSHAEDDTTSDDDDGWHCHDFGRWQYCH
ncbi:hypothetical protein CV023_17210 [Brevibacterium sp. CCUG 69071]|nr:hypothetical protein [Brevibacterium sp. CCUG 69071]